MNNSNKMYKKQYLSNIQTKSVNKLRRFRNNPVYNDIDLHRYGKTVKKYIHNPDSCTKIKGKLPIKVNTTPVLLNRSKAILVDKQPLTSSPESRLRTTNTRMISIIAKLKFEYKKLLRQNNKIKKENNVLLDENSKLKRRLNLNFE